MGLFKCCVGGCNATNETHRLFSFPKNDNLRNLWMSFLVPTNSLLIGLSKEQLLRKRVCEKHFDKQQFDERGQRLRYSYPCLFTEKEIAHGIPLSSDKSVIYSLSDHNYSKKKVDGDDEVPTCSFAIGRADENTREISSCSNFEVEPLIMERQNVSVQYALRDHDYHKEMDHEDNEVSNSLLVIGKAGAEENYHEFPSCSNLQLNSLIMEKESEILSKHSVEDETISEDKNCFQQRSKGSVKTRLSSKKNKFIKHVTKLASNSIGQTAMQRLEQAAQSGNNEHLFKNFNCLSKQAQTFLLMQLKQCGKNKMARRFTLDEKLTALILMKQSPKSYRLLENMFTLPSKRTLNRLSEKIIIRPGLNIKIFDYMQNKTKNWDIQKKLCTVVFDEISLSPHVSYDEKMDEIYGFVDVAGERKMRFCDHALVFMVRGICSSWKQTIAFYFCEGTVSSAALQNILQEIVTRVAETGLIPLGLVCDQGSTFRTSIKSLRKSTIQMRKDGNEKDDGTVHIAGYDLSVFFDPPHLLKGMRNNFLNKNIIWEQKTASWKDIQFIYDLDIKLGHTRALPKLTAHHVDPDKIKKMKVSVAAQVFSFRTATMLKFANEMNHFHGDTSGSMGTTAEVVEFIDKLFDSVNGYPGGATKGKLRKAVKINSPHNQFWTEAIRKIKKIKFEDRSSKLAIQSGKPRFVQVPSLDGWIITLESFIRITKLLFEKYGVEYYYPRNINQDPLENFFGRVRALNYRNINPDAKTFIYTFKSLLLSNVLSPHSKFANCEVDSGDTLIDGNFLFLDSCKENININSVSTSSTSQDHKHERITKDEVVLEKIKVQCSAYTAGFICRKMTKYINCNKCLKTYTSSSTNEDIHAYIQHREYKMLKNNNLAYPNSKMLIVYRDASNYIHNYLNSNGDKKYVKKCLILLLNENLEFSWLGCNDNHSNLLKKSFLNNIIRLHVHNWSNILNKILKGDVEEKYINKMGNIHRIAYDKYKTYRLRKKKLNK